MSILATIETDAEKALAWLSGEATKVEKIEPQVVAALGVVLGKVNTALSSVEGAVAADGLNIPLDAQTLTNLKAVWPALVSFAASIGIKI